MADSSGDKTIKELTQIQSIEEADTIPVWDESAQGNNTLKMPVGMLGARLNTFQPGDTWGGTGSSGGAQYPGACFTNNAHFTATFPKSVGNRTVSFVPGSLMNVIVNGASINLINNPNYTISTSRLSDYQWRVTVTGSFSSHANHAAVFNSNGFFTFS